MPTFRIALAACVCLCLLSASGCGAAGSSGPPLSRPSSAASTSTPTTSSTPSTSSAASVNAEAGAASGQWSLSAPDQVDGYPRYQPSASEQREIAGQLSSDAAELGITGAPVSAVYEDRTDLLYAVFAGLDGTFDPASLHDKLWQPPATRDNGNVRITVDWKDIDPGPHGGAAICKQTLTQTGALAVEATSCYWMSPNTFGEVFLIQDPHAQTIVYDQTAADIGPLMLKLRAVVEQRV